MTSAMSTLGIAAMSGVRCAAAALRAENARCTSVKFVVQ